MTQNIDETKQAGTAPDPNSQEDKEKKETDQKLDENQNKKQDDTVIEENQNDNSHKVEIDYQKAYEEEIERRKRAEKAIEKNKKEKKKKEEEDDDIDWSDEDEDIDDKVDKKVSEHISKFQQDMVSDIIENSLDSMTNNEHEKKLIKFHYENTVNKQGYSAKNVRDDMEIARAIANRKRLEIENRESKLAQSKQFGFSNTSFGSNQSKYDGFTEVKLSQSDLLIFNRMNQRRGANGQKSLSKKEFMEKISNN